MVDEKSSGEIDELNAKLKGQPYKLAVVDPRELTLLEKNARFMTADTFQNLTNNIRKDGGLTSIPFCVKGKKGDMKVLSGNHRVQAAISADMEEILVLYTDRKLSRKEEVAIQLSHNSLTGSNDEMVLKELWDEINDVDMKYYSGLSDKDFGLSDSDLAAISEVDLDYGSVWFLFLPSEEDRVQDSFEMALKRMKGLGYSSADTKLFLASYKEYDRMLNALEKAKCSYHVKNMATAMMLVLDVFEKNITDLSKAWEPEDAKPGWVPLATIIGTDVVPAEAARVIQKAVKRMMDKGDITKKNLWQALEFLCADYLSGGE